MLAHSGVAALTMGFSSSQKVVVVSCGVARTSASIPIPLMVWHARMDACRAHNKLDVSYPFNPHSLDLITPNQTSHEGIGLMVVRYRSRVPTGLYIDGQRLGLHDPSQLGVVL